MMNEMRRDKAGHDRKEGKRTGSLLCLVGMNEWASDVGFTYAPASTLRAACFVLGLLGQPFRLDWINACWREDLCMHGSR